MQPLAAAGGAMTLIRKTRLSEQVVDAIETMSAEGDFSPGTGFIPRRSRESGLK